MPILALPLPCMPATVPHLLPCLDSMVLLAFLLRERERCLLLEKKKKKKEKKKKDAAYRPRLRITCRAFSLPAADCYQYLLYSYSNLFSNR